VSSATVTTCTPPTSTTINGLPAASCGSGFDAQLDAILGYFDADDSNTIDTFFASFAPNTGVNYETYLAETNNGTELRRLKRELIRRHKSLASKALNILKKDIIKVSSPVCLTLIDLCSYSHLAGRARGGKGGSEDRERWEIRLPCSESWFGKG